MRLINMLSLFAAILMVFAACGSEEAKAPNTSPEATSERGIEAASTTSSVGEGIDLAVLDTAEAEPVEEEPAPKAAKPAKRPKASAPGAVHDFGFIDEGDKIEHTFTIRNDGNAILEVKDVESACGCTVAKLSEWKIEPGKNTEVKTVFDSLNKFGKQRKTITITTNAGKVELALVGVVRPKGFKADTTGR